MSKHSRLSRIYRNMKQRCYNTSKDNYKYYGGRSISICSEWLDISPSGMYNYSKGFLAFKEWALKSGYTDNLTLDRIDNNKGYSSENCRWVSTKVQCNNRCNNKRIIYKGASKTLAQWSEALGIAYPTLYARIYQYHWSVERAFST